MPGHYGLKKTKSAPPKGGRKDRSAKMTKPMKDSGKRMTPAMKKKMALEKLKKLKKKK